MRGIAVCGVGGVSGVGGVGVHRVEGVGVRAHELELRAGVRVRVRFHD